MTSKAHTYDHSQAAGGLYGRGGCFMHVRLMYMVQPATSGTLADLMAVYAESSQQATGVGHKHYMPPHSGLNEAAYTRKDYAKPIELSHPP